MRLLVHVLARLAITATCTNSAAALDVQAGSPEMSFTSNLSGYPMLNSQSAIAAVRRYGAPGQASRVAPHGKPSHISTV